MTCQEIGEYIEQQAKKDKERLVQESTIQYRMGQFVANIFGAKHPKALAYDELFPEFSTRNLTSKQKEDEIKKKWQEFLGVIK